MSYFMRRTVGVALIVVGLIVALLVVPGTFGDAGLTLATIGILLIVWGVNALRTVARSERRGGYILDQHRAR